MDNLSQNTYKPKPAVHLVNPPWLRDAVIYELNTRQFTPEGTFQAASRYLPSIKELGATVIWLMPVHKIGRKNRKGTLGSPYAVQDYLSINPGLGTAEDLKHLVDEAHKLGLYVILDWVANHTAWDNVLVAEHPEWYARDWKGDFRPCEWWDWSDIIELDYSHAGLRQYMTEAMKYWIREFDLDGFRADMAGFVPLDFWEQARMELEQIKPVFMLAEWESRDLHARAFDASYAWSWWDAVYEIANKKSKDLGPLFVYYSWQYRSYPNESMRMTFVTNHDKNAWEGTSRELFGDALEAVVVLSFVGNGIPLIYNGQEWGDQKRLPLFEKDHLHRESHPMGDLYKKLSALKKSTPPLWNGKWGGRMIQVKNSAPEAVLSFVRKKENHTVFAVFNFSDQDLRVTFEESLHHGTYKHWENGDSQMFEAGTVLPVKAFSYRVFLKTS